MDFANPQTIDNTTFFKSEITPAKGVDRVERCMGSNPIFSAKETRKRLIQQRLRVLLFPQDFLCVR